MSTKEKITRESTIAVGSVLTLYVAMQLTDRLNWKEVFSARVVPAKD